MRTSKFIKGIVMKWLGIGVCDREELVKVGMELADKVAKEDMSLVAQSGRDAINDILDTLLVTPMIAEECPTVRRSVLSMYRNTVDDILTLNIAGVRSW